MPILKKLFGVLKDGREVFSYTLDNNKNLKAEILSYGGIIRKLLVKKADGEYVDIVLGRDTIEEYLNNEGYFGACIGRFGNRIRRGQLTINDKKYYLTNNNGQNTLHGGVNGFDKFLWDVRECDNGDEPALIFTATSPDGDEGFPGTLNVVMTYTLTQNNGLVIHYEATTDKDTVVNLTNHSYFNLNGIEGSNIYNLKLKMNCDFYTPNTNECIPYGEIHSVKDTPFDFTQGKFVGMDIHSDFEQIRMFGGYDHNFIINGTGFRPAAELESSETGISMMMFTDKPGVQLYTGNVIEEGRMCKNSKTYHKHDALCLETQFFPNSTEYSHFKSPILRAGEKYDFTTEYRFSVK